MTDQATHPYSLEIMPADKPGHFHYAIRRNRKMLQRSDRAYFRKFYFDFGNRGDRYRDRDYGYRDRGPSFRSSRFDESEYLRCTGTFAEPSTAANSSQAGITIGSMVAVREGGSVADPRKAAPIFSAPKSLTDLGPQVTQRR